MHWLILMSVLVTPSLNESRTRFRGQVYPGRGANSVYSKASQSDPQSELSKVCNRWATLWMAKDLKQVVDLYADDGVFLTGSGDRFTGKTAIRDLFKKALETSTSDISVRSLRTEVSGNMAYDSGEYKETIIPVGGGSKLELEGNYLIVFRKQKDGRWLIVEHAWTDKPKVSDKL